MSKLVPKYSLWEAINAALSLGMRALEEIRTLARTPGPRGVDGLGFDDMEVVHDGERGFTFRFVRGAERKEFAFTVPVVLDRGVYKESQAYVRGDGVTWGGSFWIAQDETTDKPDSGKGWRLAVKRGRDGKDGILKDPPKGGPVKVG